MSLRELEYQPRSSTLRKLANIAEGMSNANDPDVTLCLYCHKPVRASDYETKHRCRGKTFRDAYGKSKALSIMRAERGQRWNDITNSMLTDRRNRKRSKYTAW